MFKHIENIGAKILMFFSFVFSILNVQKIDTFDQNLDLENFLDFFQDRILRDGYSQGREFLDSEPNSSFHLQTQ